MDYLRAHWYWVVGLVVGLWVLMKMVGSKTSAGANLSTPAGTSITYGGTNANDAAIQAAQINGQTQLAGAQIAANQAATLAQYSVQANQDTQVANVQISGITAGRDVQIAQYTTSAAVAMNAATQAANMDIAHTQGQFALDTTNSNNAAFMHVSDNATLLGVNTNQTNLAAVQDSNAAKLAAYTIQGQVVNNQTNAFRDIALTTSNNATQVQLDGIDKAAGIAQGQLNNQADLQRMTFDLERYGVLNKGGEGGVNQLAAWNALINPASAASGDMAAANTSIQYSGQITGIIGALGTAVSEYIGAAAKAFA